MKAGCFCFISVRYIYSVKYCDKDFNGDDPNPLHFVRLYPTLELV